VPDVAEAARTSNQEKADADAASVLAAEFAKLKNGKQSAAAAQAPERGSDPWVLVPEQHAHPLPEHGSAIELAGRAKLDRRARLIPNTVDRTVVEHYRRLRTKLVQEHGKKPFGSVMVTSPNAQEGKSVTTLNLALSFAMLPSVRVLVIDGDLRRGSLGKWLGVHDRPGLSNLIEGSAAMNDVILKY
jgi:Mrp family chromosome partitioning ATPase